MRTQHKARENRIARFLSRAAVGLVSGVAANVFAFETIAILFFGLGLYSRSVLSSAIMEGVVIGLMLGPVFAMLQTPIWKAVYCEVGILGGYYIVTSIVHVIIYPYGALLENLTIILKAIVLGLIYYSSSAALGAAGTVWLADKLLAYFWLDEPAQ